MIIGLDRSKLVERVYQESSPQKAGEHTNYYARLESFARSVVPELTQTNLLFYEYTPHDQYHIDSLFKIADKLLGEELINNLNGCEACVLACAIYGHDWGMAVSQNEINLITTGYKRSGEEQSSFALLPDEDYQWLKFAKSKKLVINELGYLAKGSAVPKEIWREYVRLTHAERSKARAKHFFAGDDATFGEIVGEVCAAHWYDISKIGQLKKNKLVFNSSVNLQALSIYIRFIDLLDIGRNRTPFSLWKFVHPRDLFSANEWNKHMALQPVFFARDTKFEKILTLRIEGKTNDHRVYASLKDMENWISSQVKENETLLHELGKYNIGIIKLNWEIEAEGFEPIDIRFEFNRSKMFDLISGEIYEGDPYVFLRELLQNSIDATKIRQLQYVEKGTPINIDKLTMNVEVTHNNNGDSTIKFSDNGSGMNLNIIRNYLSVIGKSYYGSDEFIELDLKLSPISRFGVGLISCFEVADSISIITHTDPSLFEESDAFEIEIEHYDQQFRVKRLTNTNVPIGTSVTVNVLGKKWKKKNFIGEQYLKITDYLKAIAGFVPYPILINEDDLQTVILSASSSETVIADISNRYKEAKVWKEKLTITLDEIVEQQDQQIASNIFLERTTELFKSLKGVNVTGALSYFLPKETLQFSLSKVVGSSYGATAIIRSIDNRTLGVPVRWKHDDPNQGVESISASAKKSRFRNLYINGILIPDTRSESLRFNGRNVPHSLVSINIDTSKEKSVDLVLSRTSIRNSDTVIKELISPIYQEEFETLLRENTDKVNNPDLAIRFFFLARVNLYWPAASFFKESFSIENFPIPYFNQEGKIKFVEYKDLPNEVEFAPKKFMLENVVEPLSNSLLNQTLNEFQVDLSNLSTSQPDKIFINDFGLSSRSGFAELDDIGRIITHIIIPEEYSLNGIRVVKNLNEIYILEKWIRIKSESKHYNTPRSMGKVEYLYFDKSSDNIFCLIPYNFRFGGNDVNGMIFNLNHPVATVLRKTIEAYQEKRESVENTLKEIIDVEYKSNPLIGYSYSNYKGNHLQSNIAIWTKRFCLLMDQANLITLTLEEKASLQLPLEIYTCHE